MRHYNTSSVKDIIVMNRPLIPQCWFILGKELGKDLVNKVNLCMIKTIREQMENELEKNYQLQLKKIEVN